MRLATACSTSGCSTYDIRRLNVRLRVASRVTLHVTLIPQEAATRKRPPLVAVTWPRHSRGSRLQGPTAGAQCGQQLQPAWLLKKRKTKKNSSLKTHPRGTPSPSTTAGLKGGRPALRCCTSTYPWDSHLQAPTAAPQGGHGVLRCLQSARPRGSRFPSATAGQKGGRRAPRCCRCPDPKGSRWREPTAARRGGPLLLRCCSSTCPTRTPPAAATAEQPNGRRAPHACKSVCPSDSGNRAAATTAVRSGAHALPGCGRPAGC